MPNYLLHQLRDGSPIGVFDEDGEHYYLANQAPLHEDYGVSVVEAKGADPDWEDWIDQLASKSPSPRAMWDVYPHEQAPLEDVLLDAVRDTSADN